MKIADSVAADNPAADVESLVAEVADRFTEEVNHGRSPSIDEYAERYPQIADIIRQVFPALAVLNGTAPGAPAYEDDERVTGVLGDFRILRELGRGGMGVVYEAEQISLGRHVALKVLPFAAMLDKQQLARFKNEARAAATLEHPNIVAVFSVGVERGVHYYAMQLVEGQSLAQMIETMRGVGSACRAEPPMTVAFDGAGPARQAGPTDTKRDLQAAISTLPAHDSREYYRAVARLGIQAAEALDYAHQSGILHRDVKPGNLLVDDAGKLWITDFGLARIEADAGMTMTGDLLGTLRYMSPEQALAKRVVVDHRSDIYSLGVTLYEILTLQPAFAGDDRHELLRQIAFDEPHKPRQICARIPHDLETILLKGMEKNPADRYQSAQRFADDLRAFLDDQPIKAKPPNLLRRTTKWSRRHRALVAASAVILGLLTIGSIVSTALLLWERERTAQANAQSEAVIKFLVNDLLTAPLDEDKLEREVTVSDVLANADAKIDQALADQPRVEAFVRTTMAQTYNRLRKYEEAERQSRLVRTLLASHQVVDDSELNALNELTTALMEQHKLDEARHACDEVVHAYKRAFGEEDERTLRATNMLIDVTMRTAQYGINDVAVHLQFCRDHVAKCRRSLGPDHRTTLHAMGCLASCLRLLGRLQEAHGVSQQSLKTGQQVLAPDDELMRKLKMSAAHDLRAIGQFDEAAVLIEDVLSVQRRLYGDRNLTTLTTTVWLAATNLKRGHFDKAVELYQHLFDSSRAMFGSDHDRTVDAKHYLAYGLRHQGRYQAALVLMQEVLAWRRENLGPTHPTTLNSMREAARLLSRLGRLNEARAMIEDEIAILPPDEWVEREALAWQFATYPVDGIRDGKRAVELATQACEITDYKQISPIDTLAGAYAEAGDFDSAIKWEKKSLNMTTEPVIRDKYTRHLESYKNGKPWRTEP